MILSIKKLSKLRLEYQNRAFLEKDVKKNPQDQFIIWFKEAIDALEDEPNAMVLSTVSSLSHPSARVVLLKYIDKKGFVFFTNYESRKGEQLQRNPHASLLFFWPKLQRQVSIEGYVEKTTRKESIAYFAKRPKGAQIGAYISSQSSSVSSRWDMEKQFLLTQKQFRGKKIPCPKHWGGIRLIPQRFEFWQGREHRLHDRFLYVNVEGKWVISRLFP